MRYKLYFLITLLLLVMISPVVDSSANSSMITSIQKPRIIYSLKSKKFVYITIDDGYYLNFPARNFLIKNKVPVTYFLVTSLLKRERYLKYYKPLLNQNNSGNHSFTHLDTRKISPQENRNQVCRGITLYRKYLNIPSLFYRPPYGYLNNKMESALIACGYNELYLWNKTFYQGKLSPINSNIKGGDIILLHSNRYLDSDLNKLLKIIHQSGLKPGYLSER